MSAKSDLRWVVLPNGANNLLTIDNKQAVQLVKRGDTFSEVIIKDAAGNTTRLATAQGVVSGAQEAECNSRNPVMYFSNGTNMGLVVCKNDAGAFHITLDVPGGGTSKAQNRRVEVKLSK